MQQDLRGVGYAGVFEKADLVARLEETRARGRADPSIVDKFNKDLLETRFDEELKSMMKERTNKDVLKDLTASGAQASCISLYIYICIYCLAHVIQ
jgi:hypothetical protein